jgi:sterol desaturase/sphingolipid hydroxylase (fatty acid hydroxylase superfamily)
MNHDYLDPTLVAVPFFLVTLWWEIRVTARRRRRGEDIIGYERTDTRTSLGMGLGSLVTVGLINLGVFALAQWLWGYRLTDLGSGALGWAVALIGWDLAYYWTHRWEHEIHLFWAAHENHHSSDHYNLSTALRQPWTPFLMLATFPPLALLGVQPWMIMVSGGLNLIYQYWVHTETIDRLPRWFEAVFNTPSHHRVHHGSNPQYLDRNYGGILIVWDRLFGTFEPEGERVRYGLTEPFDSHNLLVVAFHEYGTIARNVRQAARWRDRWGYVFGGPKWQPTGGARPPVVTSEA